MKRLSLLVPVLALSIFAAGCDDNDNGLTPATGGPGTIVDEAIAAGSFNTLVQAVQAAGLADTLSGPGPFTVFAPTDAAFEALEDANPGILDQLLANPQDLQPILLYHVLDGEVPASQVLSSSTLMTLQGDDLSVDASVPAVNQSVIVDTDIEASNGVIHVINAVLIPS